MRSYELTWDTIDKLLADGEEILATPALGSALRNGCLVVRDEADFLLALTRDAVLFCDEENGTIARRYPTEARAREVYEAICRELDIQAALVRR